MKNFRLELTIHVRRTAGTGSCYPLVASFTSVCVLAQVLEDDLRQLLINHGGDNLIWTRDKSGEPAIAASHVFPILGAFLSKHRIPGINPHHFDVLGSSERTFDARSLLTYLEMCAGKPFYLQYVLFYESWLNLTLLLPALFVMMCFSAVWSHQISIIPK